MLEPYQKKILEMMYKQEMLLAKLYRIFSEKFPENKSFWDDLAEDEIEHARWVKKLYQAEKKDLVLFDEGKTKTYTMETIIENLEDVISAAESGEFNLARAIGHTLDFEQALIEKNIFRYFTPRNDKVKFILDRLTKETKKHINITKSLRQQALPA